MPVKVRRRRLLPYLAQDDYGRRLEPRPHRVAVLESDRLRATVALDLGGRLLSLYDRRARSRAAVRQPRRPARQPGPAQRLVLGRGRVEHRHAGPFADDDGHASRGERRRARRRADAAAVGVGADPRRRVPGRPLDTPIVHRAARPRPHPQPQRHGDADVLVDQRGRHSQARHPRVGTRHSGVPHRVPEHPTRRRRPRRRRRRRDLPVAPRPRRRLLLRHRDRPAALDRGGER